MEIRNKGVQQVDEDRARVEDSREPRMVREEGYGDRAGGGGGRVWREGKEEERVSKNNNRGERNTE